MMSYLESDASVGYAVALWRVLFGFCLLYTGFRTLPEVTTVAEHATFVFPIVEGLPIASGPVLWKLIAAFNAAVVVGPVCGLAYRPLMMFITVVHTYFFLLSKTAHNNHYYLISILAALLTITPADHNLSLRWVVGRLWRRTRRRRWGNRLRQRGLDQDARQEQDPTQPQAQAQAQAPQQQSTRRSTSGAGDGGASDGGASDGGDGGGGGGDDMMPRWCFLIHRWQIAVVYFFAGVAKIETDWLAGRFMFKVRACVRAVVCLAVPVHPFLCVSLHLCVCQCVTESESVSE